jgi:starch synthase
MPLLRASPRRVPGDFTRLPRDIPHYTYVGLWVSPGSRGLEFVGSRWCQVNVLFLASEVSPFAKTGGLADVAGALPDALKELGVDVRIAMPLYRMVRRHATDLRRTPNRLRVPLGPATLDADVWEARTQNDVPVFLIDREDLYDRPNLYGSADGDYYDNCERFVFFSHAALLLVASLGFRPALIHCHDWQTGLVPALLRGPYGPAFLSGPPRSIFTLHNLGYQGIFPREKVSLTGLDPDRFFGTEGGLEFWGGISLLKSGIVFADAVTTVSPTYAAEIQTPEFGMGMHGVLQQRKDRLTGILNGIDYRVWNPASDPHLDCNYDLDHREGKAHCKVRLLQELGLNPALGNRPVLGMVSRLDRQKSPDLLLEILEPLLDLQVGLVVLGAGDRKIEAALRQAAERFSGSVVFRPGFDESLAHRILAGADIFLIPSRYEPCGLTQMYALKYGTVPVVRGTGGLEDTVIDFDPRTGEGNGFKFGGPAAASFLQAVRRAVVVFANHDLWLKIVRNGMQADFSWERSAREYLRLYRSLVRK